MLPDKKIIAFDLDGTLTVSKSPITKDMADLLKELAKRIPIIIISGSQFLSKSGQFQSSFFYDDAFYPYIHNLILMPTSGSQVYEYDQLKKDWLLVDKEPFNENIKNKIKKLLEEVVSRSEEYGIPANPAGEIIEDRDTQITFSALGQLAPWEKKKLWDPNQEKRKKIRAFLESKLPEVTLMLNASTSIDILPKGFNKAVGLLRWLEKRNLSKQDLVYIGDGLFSGGNDFMVKEAGFDTIAVNGPEDAESLIKNWLK
jgi:hypothetical protein